MIASINEISTIYVKQVHIGFHGHKKMDCVIQNEITTILASHHGIVCIFRIWLMMRNANIYFDVAGQKVSKVIVHVMIWIVHLSWLMYVQGLIVSLYILRQDWLIQTSSSPTTTLILWEHSNFEMFTLSGNIKCRGYLFRVNSSVLVPTQAAALGNPKLAELLCRKNYASMGKPDFFPLIDTMHFAGMNQWRSIDVSMPSILIYVAVFSENIYQNIEYMMRWETVSIISKKKCLQNKHIALGN